MNNNSLINWFFSFVSLLQKIVNGIRYGVSKIIDGVLNPIDAFWRFCLTNGDTTNFTVSNVDAMGYVLLLLAILSFTFLYQAAIEPANSFGFLATILVSLFIIIPYTWTMKWLMSSNEENTKGGKILPILVVLIIAYSFFWQGILPVIDTTAERWWCLGWGMIMVALYARGWYLYQSETIE